ncbi:MAG: 50S ribosomal protein L23 [Bacilli bacterium]|nr:50S ribosomal protein L23 [Bacilli bacterium]
MAAKKAVKAEKVETKTIASPVAHDYEVILEPVLTEKSYALLDAQNKITVKVAPLANKIEIKDAFQRLYQVAVEDVKIITVNAKEKSRGGRYKGYVGGYKKAIITLAEGAAIDLFKE